MPGNEESPPPAPEVAAAWARVTNDCGCRDIYYCPAADDVECPRHSGFDVCCDQVDAHVALRCAL